MTKRDMVWIVGIMAVFVVLVAIATRPSVTPAPAATTPAPAVQAATEPAAASPATPEPTMTWQTVATWRGSGNKETESFRTASREWRLHWSAARRRDGGGTRLTIRVNRADTGQTIQLAANIANWRGTVTDTSYVHAPPGPYYLEIIVGNTDWTVTVEDQRPSLEPSR